MQIINFIHILVCILLMLLILLQSSNSGLSSSWGASSAVSHSKRGMEKVVFFITIILAIAFFLTSLISFLAFKI